jgi:hypothetical protein
LSYHLGADNLIRVLKEKDLGIEITRWILKTRVDDTSYKDRLLVLRLLPLTYDREVKDLVFFYKALYGLIDLNINDYVTFVSHGRTRLIQNPSIMLKPNFCKTTTFQASYFNRIVKLWNLICTVAPFSCFSSVSTFKTFVIKFYFSLLSSIFDIDYPCTPLQLATVPAIETIFFLIFFL